MINEIILIPLIIIFLLLAFYAIATATNLFNRIIIFILLLFGMSVSLLTLNYLLSLPKPTSKEWIHRDIDSIEIISTYFLPNIGIYLWVQLPSADEPRYYVLEWDMETAQKLQEAGDEKRENGGNGKIIMKKPFSDGSTGIDDRMYEVLFVPIKKQMPLKPYEK